MNCERIQELILTDHLDGVLNPVIQKELERHLNECSGCREFARTAKVASADIFDGLKRAQPPEHIWSRIEDSIRHENVSLEPSWLESLKQMITLPRPAFVLATLFILFMAAGTVRQLNVIHPTLSETSAEYLSSLVEDPTGLATNDSNGFGTSVEQVFL